MQETLLSPGGPLVITEIDPEDYATDKLSQRFGYALRTNPTVQALYRLGGSLKWDAQQTLQVMVCELARQSSELMNQLIKIELAASPQSVVLSCRSAFKLLEWREHHARTYRRWLADGAFGQYCICKAPEWDKFVLSYPSTRDSEEYSSLAQAQQSAQSDQDELLSHWVTGVTRPTSPESENSDRSDRTSDSG